MKIYYTEKVNKLHNRSAITFVEMMVAVVVASLVFGVAYNFMSDTRHNYMYGTVNLRNLFGQAVTGCEWRLYFSWRTSLT